MSAVFTDDDIRKTVESADGAELGVVVDVDEETAYVEPDTDLADSTRAVLDWEGSAEDLVPLADTSVREITDETVRLESAFPEESLTTGTTNEKTPSERSGRSNRDAGYAPGEPVDSGGTETETTDAGSDRDLGTSDPGAGDTLEEGPGMNVAEDANRTEERTDTEAEAMESVEADASRELDVDPTELTDRDSEAEIEPGEDVGRRSRDSGEEVGTSGPTTEDAGSTDVEDPETERRSETDDRDAETDR